MLEGIIYCKEESVKSEFYKYFADHNQIKASIVSNEDELNDILVGKTNWFIIIASKPDKAMENISQIHSRFPHIHLIYYYPKLNIDNFHYSDFIHYSYLLVGDNRIEELNRIFNDLAQSYWKKIPFAKVGIVYDKLSPRLKKVMNYIETHDIKSSSTARLSSYLRISQGYFSQEFKRETGQTFREFMQKLLAHYEQVIFDRMDLTAKQASEILGYSELSSFSRSFKKRKGYSPSNQKAQKLVVH